MAERFDGSVVMPARVIQSRLPLQPRPRSTSFKGSQAWEDTDIGVYTGSIGIMEATI